MTPQYVPARHTPARQDLVERDEVLGTLAPAIRLSTPDDASIILIVGEIGAGKSEILRTVLDAHEATGSKGLFRAYVACHPSGEPYGPWMSLIEHNDRLADDIPEPLGNRQPAAQGPNVLVYETARALCRAAGAQPMALIFDDIQWADTSSLDLLLSVARQAAGLPLTLILACETPLHEGAPIARFVPMLLRETPAQSIELGPLSAAGIHQIARARFPDVADALIDDLSEHIRRWSGGNPLYVVEMLDGIESSGDIADALTTRRLDSLSFSLKQLAEYRLEQVSEETRQTIELASIVGDTFDLDLLDDVSDHDTEELIQQLEEALAAGILIEERDSRLRFRYGVVRQLLTETQSGLRRRQRHRAVLSALQRSCRSGTSSLDIARHAEAAGELTTAVDAFEQAGHQAVRLFNMPQAAQYYRQALGLAEQAGIDEARQDTLRLQYADCLVRSDVTAAIREYEKVAARAFVREDDATRGKARQRLATIFYETGRRADAQDILDDLLPDLERREDWQTLADALVCALYCAATESDLAAVDRLVEDLEAILDKIENSGYRALALAMKATADVARGRPNAAPGMMRDAVGIMEEIGQLDMAAPYTSVAFMRVDLFANLHRPAQIHDLVAWGRRLDAEGNRRVGLAPDPCECTPEFGLWYLLRGEWDTAREFLLDPIQIRNEARPQARKENVSVIGAELSFARGDYAQASEILDFIAPAASAPAEGHGYQPWIMAVNLRARIALASGSLDEAQEWINTLDRELEHKPHVPGELMLDLNRARVLLAQGDPDAAGQISETVIARARRTNNMLALIDGLQILAHACQTLGDPDRARRSVEEAIATATRCQLMLLQAQSRISRYEIICESGNNTAAMRDEVELLRRQMIEIGAKGAADRLDALLRKWSNERPGGLTRREIDVLALIVEGKTDNEIAELLFISPRTVSTHVGNMLAKTGTINRVELSTWAHQNNALN